MLAILFNVNLALDGGVVWAMEAFVVNAVFNHPCVVAAVGLPDAGVAVADSVSGVAHMYNDPFIVGHPRSAGF